MRSSVAGAPRTAIRAATLLWIAAFGAGACDRSGPPPDTATGQAAVERIASKLLTPSWVTINPAGYNAQLCLSSASGGCTTSAQPRQFSFMNEGTYVLSDAGSSHVDTGSANLGTLTIHPDGHFSLDADARNYFLDPTCDGGGSPATCTIVTIAARTHDVAFALPADHYLFIGFANGVGRFDPPNPGGDRILKMLRNRKYSLTAPWSWAAQGVFPSLDERFSPSPDFTLQADGNIVFAAGVSGTFSAPQVGVSRFTVHTAPIRFEGNGYPAPIGIYGMTSLYPGGTYHLIRNRRYYLHSPNAYRTDGTYSSTFSDEPDLLIDGSGNALATGIGTILDSFSFVGNEIHARVAPINYVSNGSIADVTIYYFFPTFTPSSPMLLMRGRRYLLYPVGNHSVDPGSGQPSFDPPPGAPGLQVSAGGTLSLIGGPTRNFTFDTVTSTFAPRVQRITINPSGFTGSYCVRGVLCKTGGQVLSENLIVGRRYTIDPGGTPVTIDLAGNCSVATVPLSTATATVTCGQPASLPAAPTALRAQLVSASQVDLAWTDNSLDETGFRAERSADGGSTWSPIAACAVAARQTSCSDPQTLTAGIAYRYRVQAFNAAGGSPYSNVVTLDLTPLPAPTALSGDAESTGVVSLRWLSTATSEQGFRIERSSGSGFAQIGTTGADVLSFLDTTAVGTTAYTYRVRAYNGLGDSLPSNEITLSAVLPTPAPTSLTATLGEWLGVTGPVFLTWTDLASNEAGYRIERATGPGGFALVGTVLRDPGGASYQFVDWIPSGSFSYRVKAFNNLGESSYSNTASVGTSAPTPAVVAGTLNSFTRIDLTWTAATGATSGTLLRSTDGAAFVSIATPNPATTLAFSDVTVSAGRTYVYRLDATNLIGTVSSNSLAINTAVPTAPTALVSTVPSTTSIALSWSYVSNNETGFRIERWNGSSFASIGTVARTARTYTDPGRSSGSSYRYRVIATNNGGSSLPSNEAIVAMARPGVPTAPVARVGATNRVDFTWADSSSNENEFRVERAIVGGPFSQIAAVGPNVVAHSDGTVSAGANYRYRVCAYNAFGCSSYATAADLPLVTPSAPSALAATIPSATRVDLTWTDAANNETAYRVERAADGVTFTTFWSLAAGTTSFSDTTVQNGQTYTYRVTASNAFGSSTAAILIVPVRPPVAVSSFVAVVSSTTQINLTWTFSGAFHTGFRIERSVNGQAYTVVNSPAASVRAFNNTGLSANNNYVYRIFAVNVLGDSAEVVTPITRTAAPAAPTNLVAKVMTTTRVDLTWTDVATNETSYRVQTSTNSGSTWTTLSAVLAPNTQSYSITGLNASTTYHLRVYASNAVNNTNSNTEITRTAAPNGAPNGLVATVISASQIRLTWNEAILNENGFEVERSLTGTSGWAKVGEAARNIKQYDDLNLLPSTRYYYRVRAFNGITPPSAYTTVANAQTSVSCATSPNGTPCSDGNLCTTNDTCQAGVCAGGAPVSCPAATACSTFACVPATGVCQPTHRPLGTACNDSNACTTTDTCNGAGSCGGLAKSCDDSNACTVDSCVPATGVCQNVAGSCGLSLLPACTMTDPGGQLVAVFGYVGGASNLEVAHGPSNDVLPALLQGRQPRWFRPGTQEAAFVVPVPTGTNVSWKLGTQTVVATSSCSDAQRQVANASQYFDPQILTSAIEATDDLTGSGQTIGGTGGELDVGHTGAASYRIPLDLPAGRMGIEPSLSLVYSSNNNSNGLMGVGWSLSGLSSIHRCQKTIYQDGDAAPIRFKADDALCLDGERLVVEQGPLADNRTEYRTERESFSRIVSHGVNASGPTYFIVRTSDGKTLTFGFPDGSDAPAKYAKFTPRDDLPVVEPSYGTAPLPPGLPGGEPPIEIDPQAVLVDWPLTQVTDRHGNSMKITYKTTPSTSLNNYEFERRPEEITYTHHSAAPALRAVKFKYDARSVRVPGDPKIVTYVGGVKLAINDLLTAVEIWTPNLFTSPQSKEKTRSYELTYQESIHTHRALLAGVRECDARTPTICQPLTQFGYSEGSSTFQPLATGITADDLIEGGAAQFDKYRFARQNRLQVADMNGDGLDDLMYRRYNTVQTVPFVFHYRTSTGTSFGSPIQINAQNPVSNGSTDILSLLDVDGDGQAEVNVYRYDSGQQYFDICKLGSPFSGQVYCNVVDGSPAIEREMLPLPPFLFSMPADLNGDGLPELLRSRDELFLKVRENVNGVLQGYSPAPITDQMFGSSGFDGITAFDINGDGRDELLLPAVQLTLPSGPSPNKLLYRSRKAGGALETGTPNLLAPAFRWPHWPLDANGDGLLDVAYVRSAPDFTVGSNFWELVVQFNTGNGYLPPTHLLWEHRATGNQPAANVGIDFPSRATYHDRDDDNVRIVDYDGDGTHEILLVDDNDYGISGETHKRSHLRVLKFQPDGSLQGLYAPIPVGAHANGPSGIDASGSNCIKLKCPTLVAGQSAPGSDCTVVSGSVDCSANPLASEMTQRPFGYHLSQTLDANGDGLTDFVQYEPGSGQLVLYLRSGAKPDLLNHVTKPQGGGSLHVGYAHIADRSRTTPRPLFTPATYCPAGFSCPKSQLWVVSEVSRDNGTGTINTWLKTFHSYTDARYSRSGWGFLGFLDHFEDTERAASGFVVKTAKTTRYKSFTPEGKFMPYIGVADGSGSTVERIDTGGLKTTHSTNHGGVTRAYVLPGGKRYEFRTEYKQTDQYESPPGGSSRLLSRVSESFTFHTQGRLASWKKIVTEGVSRLHTELVQYTQFHPDATSTTNLDEWVIGPPTRTVVTSSSPGEPTAPPRTTSYDYDPQNLFLRTATREPESTDPDEKLTTTYAPAADGTGQVARVTEVALTGVSHVMSYGYDPVERIYQQTATNKLGMTTTTLYHPAIDKPAVVRDVNGVVTRLVYDTFGRIKKKDLPVGMGDVSIRLYSGPRIETSVVGGTTTMVHYDQLGRPVQTVENFAGSGQSITTTEYDVVGRVWRTSQPRQATEAPIYSTFEYDELGRTTRVLTPSEDGAVRVRLRNEYSLGAQNLQRTTSYDGENRRSYTETDERGLVVKSVDILVENGTEREVTTEYDYGAFGRLNRVRVIPAAAGEPTLETTFAYDDLGRRRTISDSNRGTSQTFYNAFGELRESRDAQGQPTILRYDDLGRLRERAAPEGTSTWVYDSALGALGALHTATSSDGVVDTNTYDGLGRVLSRTTQVAGQPLEFVNKYDAAGRVERVTYPATPGWPRFEVTNQYHSTGELIATVRTDTGADLWRANTLDAAGRVLSETLGQALNTTSVYSPLSGRLVSTTSNMRTGGTLVDNQQYAYYEDGNVRWRGNSASGLYEHFVYDSLDRLETWQAASVGGAPQPASWQVKYQYSQLGNLMSRSVTGSGGPVQVAGFGYGGQANAGPGALTSWGFTGGGQPNADGIFTYDANHRVRTHPRLGTIDYNSFDLPIRIRGGTVVEADFGYNASGTRAYKREGGTVTLYAGGLYEMRILPDQAVEHVLHLPGGDGAVGQLTRARTSSGTLSEQATFYTTDHLGSTTAVVDAGGNLLERKKSDPFGNALRNSAHPVLDTQSLVMSLPTHNVRVGFTGHEHDEALGVINMRGRIYEPMAGRFLTPDPVLGGHRAQSRNAYAYVLNNPLAFVDPSGFLPADSMKAQRMRLYFHGVAEQRRIQQAMDDLDAREREWLLRGGAGKEVVEWEATKIYFEQGGLPGVRDLAELRSQIDYAWAMMEIAAEVASRESGEKVHFAFLPFAIPLLGIAAEALAAAAAVVTAAIAGMAVGEAISDEMSDAGPMFAPLEMSKGGRQKGRGDDPAFSMSPEQLKEAIRAAKAAGNTERVKTLEKIEKMLGSRNKQKRK
jgi:RHS repeat-associated protein